MSASFDGNDGNDGNAGSTGNATSTNVGWFFADRVDLPFISIDGEDGTPVSGHRIDVARYPLRNWAADWYSWAVLTEFAQIRDAAGNPAYTTIALNPWDPTQVQAELDDLALAARVERADALGEILSQSEEFISYYMNLMTGRPTNYSATMKLLTIASQIGTFVVMYYKMKFSRPRPSELLPALLPPIVVPGHASFPSGHSTQSHLMAGVMGRVLTGFPQHDAMLFDLLALADRISRNREIAGVHYPSDTQAGVDLAAAVLPLLDQPIPGLAGPAPQTLYQKAFAAAVAEWDPANPANQ